MRDRLYSCGMADVLVGEIDNYLEGINESSNFVYTKQRGPLLSQSIKNTLRISDG